DLFPAYPAVESPIVPAGTEWPFKAEVPPAVPDTVAVLPDNGLLASRIPAPRPQVGSNNWAIGGSRSATGLPILANDPHLQLTLPSIWYQMQLSSPSVNVYGVALPGTPAIIIRLNKDVAWGVTNTGSDVMDFYRIRFRDSSRHAYWHDGQWKETTLQVETFRLKGEPDVHDTVYYTHHGPVDATNGLAMRWVANETDG